MAEDSRRHWTIWERPNDNTLRLGRSGDPDLPDAAEGRERDDLDRTLNKESGLKGLGGSADLREIAQAAAGGDAHAQLALDVFVHRLSAGIGQMLAALGGLDAIVFTGGIGENSAPIRERACRPFAFLGLEIDPALTPNPPTAILPPDIRNARPRHPRQRRLGNRPRGPGCDLTA